MRSWTTGVTLAVGVAAALAVAPMLQNEGEDAGAGAAGGAAPFSLFGLALYTRLKKTSVREQETRDRIFEYVREYPGATAPEISRGLGIHRTTVCYHLRVLEREKYAVSRNANGRIRYFLAGAEEARHVDAMCAQEAEPAKRIVEAATATPGIGIREASKVAGVHRITVHYHVKNLAEAGLLVIRREGRALRLFPSAAVGNATGAA